MEGVKGADNLKSLSAGDLLGRMAEAAEVLKTVGAEVRTRVLDYLMGKIGMGARVLGPNVNIRRDGDCLLLTPVPASF